MRCQHLALDSSVHTKPGTYRYPKLPRSRRRQVVCAKKDPQHLSVCTNKTCKKQGSEQIAKFAEDLGLEGLTIERTGCLGKCGNGPNMVLSPLKVTLSHVNTVAKMTEVLRSVGGYEVPESLLKATKLRLTANGEARSGKLSYAAELYTEALNLDPPYGKHLLLSNRSGVLLSLGKAAEALKDADAAAAIAPPKFRSCYIRQVEARAALEEYGAAKEVLEKAAANSADFAKSAEYKSLSSQLAKVLPIK